MRLFVTGVGGQLGHDVVNNAVARGYEAIGSDIQPSYSGVSDGSAVTEVSYVQLDITDKNAVLSVIEEIKPDVIIHCAAWTAVDAAEYEANKDIVHEINALGTQYIADAAKSVDAKMLYLSTDYVFDGSATEPYDEFSPVAPLGAYGKTKLEGENFVRQFADRFFIVRTAWLYGDGKNFVKTMLNIGKEKGEVGVVADQVGSPTSAKELAKAIHVLEPTDNYGVFHGTCEGYCSWADFAEKIFEYAGMDVKVNRLTTDEYPTPAKRPAYSVLNNYMLTLTTDFKFAEWEDALKEYFDEMN